MRHRRFEKKHATFSFKLSACGRKRTLDFVDFGASERPLSRKADILIGFAKIDTPRAAFSMMSLLCGQTRVVTLIGQRKGEMS